MVAGRGVKPILSGLYVFEDRIERDLTADVKTCLSLSLHWWGFCCDGGTTAE